MLFESTVKADLAGQLLIRNNIDRRIQLADFRREPPFLDKPWEEAIAYFRNRGIVDPNELSTLLRGYAQRADVARLLMLKQIQEEVRNQLEKSLTEGGTYQEFARALADGKESLGITNADPSYLKMVFRTNIQGAYGAGRFKAITDPVVMAERPFVQYRTVGDARVRESHVVLDKTVYRSDSSEWERICPPNGIQCRCAVVTLTRDDPETAKVQDAPPADYVADPDFDRAPTARIPLSALTKDEQTEVKRAPIVQVPEKLQAKPTFTVPRSGEQNGAVEKQVFGDRQSDTKLHQLFGLDRAKLPSGFTSTIADVTEIADFTTAKGTKVPGYVKVEATIHDKRGEQVGKIVRAYKKADGGKIDVEHSSFYLDEAIQGSGIGREIFNAQIDAYERLGNVRRVELTADSVGKYVWTKAGFDWTDAADFKSVKRDLAEALTSRVGAAAAKEILAEINTPSDIARVVVDGEKIGKDLLIAREAYIDMAQTPSKITRL